MYTIWGGCICPDSASQLYSGIAAYGNERKSFCFSLESKFKGDPSELEKDTDIPKGVQVISIPHAFESSSAFLECALCSVPNKSIAITVPSPHCPNDEDWTKEYDGFLLISPNSGIDYICVKSDAEGFTEGLTLGDSGKILCSVCTHV